MNKFLRVIFNLMLATGLALLATSVRIPYADKISIWDQPGYYVIKTCWLMFTTGILAVIFSEPGGFFLRFKQVDAIKGALSNTLHASSGDIRASARKLAADTGAETEIMTDESENGRTKMLSAEGASAELSAIDEAMDFYCPYCMRKLGSEATCPSCGKMPSEYCPFSHHIPPNTILKNRYVVGRCLGEGGFGITYLGLDTELNRKVAIKEYFPNNFVHREGSSKLDVTCNTGGKTVLFEKGRHQFLEEARVMARLDGVSEIVRVLDYFAANNTAYIIMEYLSGKTLRQHLAEQGRIPAEELLGMMEPMMRAIKIMHGEGIIHRDISPDNMMLLNNGTIKMLDFGCARDTGEDHTMTVMLKHGYAPIEQYTGHNQGSWTDVYALCATLYRCLTGQVPPSALDRMEGHDPIIPPRELGAGLTDGQERAIMKGLSVKPEDRWQSITELYAALYEADAIKPKYRGRKIVPLPFGGGQGSSMHDHNSDLSGVVELKDRLAHYAQDLIEQLKSLPQKTEIAGAMVCTALLAIILIMSFKAGKTETPVDREGKYDLDGESIPVSTPAGDNRPVIEGLVWSDWADHLPADINGENSAIRCKLQYRSAPLHRIEDGNPQEEGYTVLRTEYGAGYGKYTWRSSPISENESIEVTVRKKYQYERKVEFVPPSTSGIYIIPEPTYEPYWTSAWQGEPLETSIQYGSRPRHRIDYCYSADEWSEFTDEPLLPNNETVVSTRMMYRYAETQNGQVSANRSMDNFPYFSADYTGRFADVDDINAWYGAKNSDALRTVSELGILLPDSNLRFHPDDPITVGQTIRAAVMIQRIYQGCAALLDENNGQYQIYADYAVENEIIAHGEFPDLGKAATRQELAYILSGSLPAEELQKRLQIGVISDMDSEYYDYAISLAKAGVVSLGNGNVFRPEDTARRAEAASMIDRLIYPEHRVGRGS